MKASRGWRLWWRPMVEKLNKNDFFVVFDLIEKFLSKKKVCQMTHNPVIAAQNRSETSAQPCRSNCMWSPDFKGFLWKLNSLIWCNLGEHMKEAEQTTILYFLWINPCQNFVSEILRNTVLLSNIYRDKSIPQFCQW